MWVEDGEGKMFRHWERFGTDQGVNGYIGKKDAHYVNWFIAGKIGTVPISIPYIFHMLSFISQLFYITNFNCIYS